MTENYWTKKMGANNNNQDHPQKPKKEQKPEKAKKKDVVEKEIVEEEEGAAFNDHPDYELRESWKKEQLELKRNLITTDQFDFDINSIWPKPEPAKKKVINTRKVEGVHNILPYLKTPAVEDENRQLKRIGGVDISFVKGSKTQAVACLVVLSFPSLEVIYTAMKPVQLTLPYISGFLAFREVEHLVGLVKELRETKPELLPQVILVDGNGVLHHRGFGLASHFGVLCDIPTIGIGKSFLTVDGMTMKQSKDWESQLQKEGDFRYLQGKSGTIWGTVLRPVQNSNTGVFVSVGHRVSLHTATAIACRCALFKLPEPVRKADLLSREFVKKNYESQDSLSEKNQQNNKKNNNNNNNSH